MNQKLWDLLKSTLVEKNSNPIMGSIKRGIAWALMLLVCLVVITGCLPGGSIHIGNFINFAWNHKPTDTKTLGDLLEAIGTYVLGGQFLSGGFQTTQNYHNVKYGNGGGSECITNK